MAVLARAMVTLASIKDVASTIRYYKLLSSTATKPSAPTTNPPDNTWSTTEPTYSSTSTNTLYFVDLTVFSDGDFAYSEVSKSTSYEAAKSAYNVAQNAKDVADSAQESIDNLEIGGRNLGLYSKTFSNSPSKDNRYFSWRGTGNIQIRTDGFTEQVSTQNWNGIRIYANSLGLKVSDTVTFSCNVRNDSTIQNKVYFYCMAFDSSGNRDTTSKFLHVKAENMNADGQGGIVTNIEPNSEKRIWVTLTWLQLAEDLVNADGSIEFSFQSWSTDWTAGSMSYYAPKIEKGNVMTDWSPAPEDLDIDSLGGRNILLDGNFTNGFDKWSFNYSSGASMPEIVTEDGIKCCHYQGEIGKASQVRQNILDKIANDEVGQQYTVSFDIKLVNYTSGTTNPFLQVYFSGTYDDNGTQKYMGATWGKEQPNLVPYNNKGWIHVIVSNLYFANKPINEMWFMIYSRDWSGDLYFTNLKLERGNKATDWTPAPEDFEESVATVSNTLTDYINSTEIIVGTQTAATGSWTGVAGFSELRDGQQIAYWLPYAGSGNASLNLTLSDGTTTGAITVYYKGTTVATTHFTAGTVIHLTYRVNANVNGTAHTGWWADASYDSGNTYNRIRFENAIFAKSAISASRFIVGDDAGFFHLVGGSAFDITKPILWATNAIGAGKTATTNYIAINSATLRNNLTGINLTQYKTCYLVGTLSGKIFTTKLTDFFTSTIPTEDDGYYYISFGYLYSTYQVYLYPEHPIYKFVDGEFKNLNQVAYEASVLASEAKDDIENLEVGGRNLLLDSEKETVSPAYANATVYTPYYYVSDYGKPFVSEAGTLLTVSCEFEVIGNENNNAYFYFQLNNYVIINIKNYGMAGTESIPSNSYSGIFKRSFALSSDQAPKPNKRARFGLVNATAGTVLKIRKIKLELGNRSTDWTPAPEDVEYAMNNVSIEATDDSFINYTFDGARSYYPSTITLTPFINGSISYSKWQYKTINGATWTDVVSGSNGLTISSSNELVIANSSNLFTDTCSSITFKCVSDNESFYSLKTIVREDDPTRVYNTVKTRVDQTDNNLSLIASATELAEYSTSSTLNTRLSNVSLSSDEILMVVSQSVNNLTNASGIKGVYSETTAYAKNNIVILDGKFYQAKSASTGKTPPNTTYWTDVTSSYSESKIKTAFSKIVALQDSITLTVSGASGSSSTLNLGDGTLSMSVTDVATILADKELNLTSTNGVININGNGGVNIGTSSKGAITINSPNFSLDKDGNIISVSGSIGGWNISSQDLVKHTIELRGENGGYYSGVYNPWKLGRTYFVGDIVSRGLSVTSSGNINYINYICTQQHKAQDFQTQSNYWKLDMIWSHQVPYPKDYTIYNMDFNSYNCSISIFEENYNISTEVDTAKSAVLSVDGLSISSSSNSVPTELRSDGLYHDIGHGEDLSKLYIYSSGYLELEGTQGIKLGAFTVGTNTGLSSIGDGTITGAISTLNSSKSNLLTTKFYRTNDNTISASSYKDITYNVALSGYTAIGLVGARVEGNSSVALFGFYLGTSDNTAYARVKNLTSSSQTGVKVGFTVLYVKN